MSGEGHDLAPSFPGSTLLARAQPPRTQAPPLANALRWHTRPARLPARFCRFCSRPARPRASAGSAPGPLARALPPDYRKRPIWQMRSGGIPAPNAPFPPTVEIFGKDTRFGAVDGKISAMGAPPTFGFEREPAPNAHSLPGLRPEWTESRARGGWPGKNESRGRLRGQKSRGDLKADFPLRGGPATPNHPAIPR